jgi:hypothetical protein
MQLSRWNWNPPRHIRRMNVLHNFDGPMYLAPAHGSSGSGEHTHSQGSSSVSGSERQKEALVTTLGEKLRNYSANLEQMLRLNSAWQQAGAPSPNDDLGWSRVADLYGCGDNDLRRIRAALKRRPMHRAPFSEHELASLKARLARIARRISSLRG